MLVERSDSRAPLASLTIDAVTPAPAALILSRIDARLVSVGPIVMLTGELPAFALNAVAGSPLQVPSSILKLPSPTTLVLAAYAVLVTVCDAASLLTLML